MKPSSSIITEALTIMESDRNEEFLEEIQESLRKAVEHTHGKYSVQVDSAVVLTEPERASIEEITEKIFQAKLKVSYHVKSELLGGFKISVGDWKLDATVLSRLEQLRKLFTTD